LIDRLKPAYVLQDAKTPMSKETPADKKTQSTTTTRSGRPSKPPVRFK